MGADLTNIAAVVPSYKPDEKLIRTVDSLIEAGFTDICVIDDGGGEKFRPIFDTVAEKAGVTVLVHRINRGKGAAMKTAFSYLADNRPDLIGVVTVDGDGQHLPVDVVACAEKMRESGRAVLGCRNFSGDDVPPRSKFGNGITSFVFLAFNNMKVSDTQTGLRAFPARYLRDICNVGGDRYEYETNLLLKEPNLGMPHEEQVIHTVYIDDNESSHFNALRDSARIYSLILKHLSGKIAGAILSLVIFTLLMHFMATESSYAHRLDAVAISGVISYIAARLVRRIVNKYILHQKTPKKSSALKALSVCSLAASIVLTYLWCIIFGVIAYETATVVLLKVLSDVIVFAASALIKKKIIK